MSGNGCGVIKLVGVAMIRGMAVIPHREHKMTKLHGWLKKKRVCILFFAQTSLA